MTTPNNNTLTASEALVPNESPPVATFKPTPDLFLPHLCGRGLTLTDSATEMFKHAADTGRFFRRERVAVKAVGQGASAFIETMNPHSFRSAIESVGRVTMMKSSRPGTVEMPQPALMTSEQAHGLLSCTEALFQLPELIGTTRCPILAKTQSGYRLCHSGYSPELKLWIFGDHTATDVPLAEAVGSLRGLNREFQFSGPGDESRAFAAFITPMLHFGAWLDNASVPVDVAEADQSQSGKTYRQKIVAAIYGDEPSYVNMKARGVGGVDESIQSMIFEGKSFLAIDNAKVSLDSEFLEQTITNTTGLYRIRLPGMKEVEVRAKFIVQVSSNSPKMSRDMANRSVLTRIVKRVGHEYVSNPLADVQSNPGYYLGCVVSVVKEWARLGCPSLAGADHDFKKWAGAMDYIVQNIAGLPPLLEGHRDAQARTNDPTLSFLREIAFAVDEAAQLQTSLSAARLLEIAATKGINVVGVDSNANDEDGKSEARRMLGIKLAPIFNKTGCVTIDRYTILRMEEVVERDQGKGKTNERRYHFSKKLTFQPEMAK